MDCIVIDNSVVMTWAIEDQADAYADAVHDALGSVEVIMPPIWPFEVANSLLVAERRKLISRQKSDGFLGLLAGLPIAVQAESPSSAWAGALAVARKTGLSAYDASYLHLASRSGCPIATLDRAMHNAAKKVGVAVFRPR